MNIKVEISICNWNELTIKMPSHPKQLKEMPKEPPIYVFPRHTNRTVDY